jgi:hypothetical protein
LAWPPCSRAGGDGADTPGAQRVDSDGDGDGDVDVDVNFGVSFDDARLGRGARAVPAYFSATT